METQRLPLPQILAPRAAASDKDGLLVNCYKESTPIGDMIVKRPGLVTAWNAGLGCAQGAISYNGLALVVVGGEWGVTEQAQPTFADGITWTSYAEQTHPGTGLTTAQARTGILGSLGGNLYYIGLGGSGASNPPNVYYSTDDGDTWTTLVTSPAWSGQSLISIQLGATLGSSLYIVLNNAGASAVWSTSDGPNWTQQSSGIAALSSSLCIALVAHDDGKLYAFSSGEVASSPDGGTWTLITGAPGWAGRTGFAAYSLNGDLYVAAGIEAGVVKNDVWKSTDNGATWSQITAAAAFAARDSAAYWAYDSKLWIGAGKTNTAGTTCVSDLWNTSDGITWTSVNVSFAGVAFSRMCFCNHNDTMYVGNGFSTTPRTIDVSFFAAGATDPATGDIATTPFVPTVSTCGTFDFTLIPANGSVPVKVFMKTSAYAWVYDGTTMTQVTDSDYPAATVPGVVYLDGTIYVMDSQGIIYGSDVDDPTSWDALNFISANSEADSAVVLARQLNYVAAFKQTSTEFFYDAGNPIGSPLGKVLNALLEIGCASAGSLGFSDNTIYFMANSRQKGRSIMKLEGYTPKVISNPYIDRILNADDLDEVYAFVIKSNGHFFYVITLVTSEVTLVFDEVTGEWHTWTTMEAESPVTIFGATAQTDGSVIVQTLLPHGQEDGNVVTMAGATPDAVNGTYNIRCSDDLGALFFSYIPSADIGDDEITGDITATFYSETFFPGVFYSYGNGQDLLLNRTTGAVYEFSPSTYIDDTLPIDVQIRMALLDFGVMKSKRFSRYELVGDKVDTNVLVRYSDDDYDSWSLYRTINMNTNRAKISNLGSGRRRAFQLRNTGSTALRLLAAEIDFDIGAF